MWFRRTAPESHDLAAVEAASPALVRDLRALGRATAVDAVYLEQLGARLQAQAATGAPPPVRTTGALATRWARPTLAAGVAAALVVIASGLGTASLAAGSAGVGTKVQALVEAVAGRLGVPAESVQVELLPDGQVILRAPEGTPVGPPLRIADRAGDAADQQVGRGGQTVAVDVQAIAAQALGIPREQLVREWQGRSLTALAQARGVAPAAVAEALRAQLRAQAAGLPPAKLEAIVNKLMNATATGGAR